MKNKKNKKFIIQDLNNEILSLSPDAELIYSGSDLYWLPQNQNFINESKNKTSEKKEFNQINHL